MAEKTLTQVFVDALLTEEGPEEVTLSEAFTRQHYVAIAEVINDTLASIEEEQDRNGTKGGHIIAAVEELAKKLATIFANDNRLFDKGLFLSKCGL